MKCTINIKRTSKHQNGNVIWNEQIKNVEGQKCDP